MPHVGPLKLENIFGILTCSATLIKEHYKLIEE